MNVNKTKEWLLLNRTEIVFSVIIFIAAFLPRVINLTGHSLFVDEFKWHFRTQFFEDSLFTLNIKDLMAGWWKFEETIAIGLPAVFLMMISKLVLSGFTSEVFYYRVPFTIVGSLTAVGFYLLLRRMKKPGIGIIGAFFLAMEPVFIAMSRWSHQDVILTFFFLGSIGFFCLGETEDKFSLKVISAFFFSLAFLTKINALVIPVILISWKVANFYLERDKKEIKIAFQLKELFLPFLSASLIFLLWPAMWGNPFATAISFFTKQANVLSGHQDRLIFMGKVTTNPAFYYYPVILLIRLSPLFLAAIVFGMGYFIFKDSNGDQSKLPLSRIYNSQFDIHNSKFLGLASFWSLNLIWIVLYILVISMSPKKYEARYILPIWPAIAFFVGYGLLQAVKTIKRLNKNQAVTASVALILIFEVPVAFIYSPNYYLYYNFLAGGPAGARRSKLTIVGFGDAAKPLALFVKKRYSSKNVKIVHYGHNPPFLYYLTASLRRNYNFNKYLTKDGKNPVYYSKIKRIYPKDFDVIVLESHWIDRDAGPSVKQVLETGKYKLVYTYRFAGVDLGWVLEKYEVRSAKFE